MSRSTLPERVVVNHRDTNDARVSGEVQAFDQPARMEVAEADAEFVLIDGPHDGGRVARPHLEGDRRHPRLGARCATADDPDVVA